MKKILFVASEGNPFIKTGGLADVVGALPKYIDKSLYEISIIMPLYQCIPQKFRKQMKKVTHFYENMPRMLKEGVALKIDKNSYEVPPIFKLIAERGNIPERDMYNTFNMGIGMAIIVPENEVEKSLKILKEAGEEAYLIGEVVEGNREVII